MTTKNTSESKNAENKETKKIRIYIDPKLTDGGFTTNGRRLVGYIEVDEEEAEDLKRRLEEYAEVKERLHNPSAKVTIKNSFVIEQLYLADPATNRNKPNWTDEYGLLDPWQWNKLPKEFQEELKARRYALYGIK
jgi:hypothetical protein